ncbi:MAG: type II secretion system protein [Burkholderiales bacterium]
MKRPLRIGVSSAGFTYLGVLVAIAVLGLGLLAVSEVWVTTANRQRAVELDWIGEQFTQAIGSYYYSSPGGGRTYPARLDDLLEDRRFVSVRRHLRAIYPNPFTGKADWELVRGENGRIVGVRATWMSDTARVAKEYVYQPGGLAPSTR